LNQAFLQAQSDGLYEGFRSHTTEVAASAPGLMRLPRIPRPAKAARRSGDGEPVWRDSLTEPRTTERERLGVQEAREVASAVAELLAGGQTPAGEIQILARKRNVLAGVSDALRAWHVPHVRPDDLNLADEPEARDLIALLDVLASPGHDLSLAHALKSPIFGASDADLLVLAHAARGAGWWAALMRLAGDPAASEALGRAATWLGRWAEAARHLPPHDLLDQILHEGDVVARMLQASSPERREHARGVIDKLLAQTLALDGGRYATPYGFVRALRARTVKAGSTADAQAVQLLTVHGAKGLESDVVFLMDCDPEARNPESGSLLADWPVDLDHPSCVAVVGQAKRIAPSLLALRDLELHLAQREELNALYVAATRARRQLVISSMAPHRKASDVAWWDRLAPFATPWHPQVDVAAKSVVSGPVVVDDWAALAAAHPRPAVGEAGVSQVWVAAARGDKRITLVGEAFHRLMQWACGPQGPQPGSADRAWIEQALPAAAAEFGLTADEAAHAARATGAVLGSPAFAAFRPAAGLLWAGDEVGLSASGEVIRIDRLVARDDNGERVWWVLDYKLEHQPDQNPDYLAQMARYRQAVALAQPGERVRSVLVSGAGAVIEVS
jgi:ATP-dependent helicase/nuclease subunit A